MPISPVTDRHFRAFGAIVHMFARFESLMVGVMAHVAHADVLPVTMLTSELPYRAKREALLAMIKAKPLPKAQQEKLGWFLGQLHRHNQLRNAIAHSIWRAGSRELSIKPLSMSVRGGAVKIKGPREAEAEYTPDDLDAIVVSLMRLHTDFFNYLSKNELFPRKYTEEENQEKIDRGIMW